MCSGSFAKVPLKAQRADSESDAETESTAGTDAVAAEVDSSTGADFSDFCTDDEASSDENDDAHIDVGICDGRFRHRCPPGLCTPGFCGCLKRESQCVTFDSDSLEQDDVGGVDEGLIGYHWDVVGSRMS